MLLTVCTEVLRAYVNDTVGIDIECNFDLRNTTRCRSDTVEDKVTELLVVSCDLTLTLEYVNVYLRLVVSGCGVNLALLCRDRCVSLDHLCEYAAFCLDTEGKRCNVEKEKSLHVTGKNCRLDSRTDRNALVRVDALERLFAEVILNRFLNGRDTCGTTDQKDLLDIVRCHVGICHSAAYRLHRCFNEVTCEFIELRTCKSDIEVLRACRVCCDVRQVDVGSSNTGKLDLCLLSSFLQSLHRHLICCQVDALFLLKCIYEVIYDLLIEVIAAETVVTGSCQYFKYTVADLEDGYIECTAAEVEYEDLLIGFLIEAVSKGCRCRLVDDTKNFKARDLTCVLGCLTLCVGEVCRNRDNRLCDGLSEVSLSVCLELRKDHRGDLLRRVLFVVDTYLVARAHFTLDGLNRSFRVRNGLTLCDLTDQTLAVFRKCDDGRSSSVTFRIRDNDRLCAFHYRDA